LGTGYKYEKMDGWTEIDENKTQKNRTKEGKSGK
jgi:hypothetical protein